MLTTKIQMIRNSTLEKDDDHPINKAEEIVKEQTLSVTLH